MKIVLFATIREQFALNAMKDIMLWRENVFNAQLNFVKIVHQMINAKNALKTMTF